MRMSGVLVIAALALAPVAAAGQSAGPQSTQTTAGQKPPGQPNVPAKPAEPGKPAAATPAAADDDEVNTGWVGSIDVGVRGTTVKGDEARYERYRDLSSGVFLEDARVSREGKGWLFDLRGQHVGYEDQRFVAEAGDPGRFKAAFLWDQIPMVLSRTTRTLFTDVGTGTLPIENALQAQVQATPAAIAPVFNQFAREFELKTRRHIADGAIEYSASEALTITTHVRHTDRKGSIPFGGSFGHSNLVETPAPTKHKLTDFDADAEYVRNPFLLRAGYTGSWFHNDQTSLTFDNPFRVTDIPATPAMGRLSLAPSNSFVGVNGMASVKLPYRSRLMAYGSVGFLQDAGDPLIPQTTNTANVIAPLVRQTVNGEARTSSVNLRFTSRPKRFTDLTVSYRSYDYDNRTPEFAMRERVAYDNVPAAVVPPILSEPHSVGRGTFDADFKLTTNGWTSAGVGYTRIEEDRTHRIFTSTTDNVLRLTFDTISRQWFSVRTKYEHAERRGEGIEQGEEELAAIGEHPEMRHYDIAQRDRDRVTIIGSVTPTGSLTTSFSVAAGKDDYIESVFGVRDNTHRVYGLGADYVANERAGFGVSYSYERYNALQRSRQANPGVQFDDPSRNWAADTTEKAQSLLLNADVARIANKVDLRLSYDFSRARGRYDYITGPVPDRTLPEEAPPVPSTLPPPVELPPTMSEFNRGSVDVVYEVTKRISLGVSYWYDQYRVKDFTLDVDAQPVLASTQALLMGYMYRPYTGQTTWVRLLYRW